MPIDNYTKDFLKFIKTTLGTVVARLDTLIGLADRLRQDEDKARKVKNTNTDDTYAALTKALISLQGRGTPTNLGEANKKWYKSSIWWRGAKEVIETMAYIFAIGYAVVTYFQWRDARDNFSRSQRPWVGPEFPLNTAGNPIISGVGPNQAYRWDYVMKNYGNSPALHSRGHARTYVLPKGWSSDWGQIKKDIETLDFLPNSEHTIFNGGEVPDSGVTRVQLSPKDSDGVQNGTILIVLGGRVQYSDATGGEHNTTWCIVYIPDPIGTPHVSRWRSCPIDQIAD